MQVRAFWTGMRYYPFVDYAMYCASKQPPVQATKTSMFAVLPDGKKIAVTPAYMGLNWHAWWHELTFWLSPNAPQSEDVAQIIAQRRSQSLERVGAQVRRVEGVSPVAIELAIQHYRIDDDGIGTGISGRRYDLVALAGETP